tara:strand:- start:99 stop:662 length:564 start_codon:yes stop_codon:yes gene_type:complete
MNDILKNIKNDIKNITGGIRTIEKDLRKSEMLADVADELHHIGHLFKEACNPIVDSFGKNLNSEILSYFQDDIETVETTLGDFLGEYSSIQNLHEEVDTLLEVLYDFRDEVVFQCEDVLGDECREATSEVEDEIGQWLDIDVPQTKRALRSVMSIVDKNRLSKAECRVINRLICVISDPNEAKANAQ